MTRYSNSVRVSTFGLFQPVRHAHLAEHRRRGREVLLRLLVLARAPVELAESEMAVGDQRAHTELVSRSERLPVARRGVLSRSGPIRSLCDQAMTLMNP